MEQTIYGDLIADGERQEETAEVGGEAFTSSRQLVGGMDIDYMPQQRCWLVGDQWPRPILKLLKGHYSVFHHWRFSKKKIIRWSIGAAPIA